MVLVTYLDKIILIFVSNAKIIQLTNYKTGLDYAKTQDQNDPLAHCRSQFHIPKDKEGNDWLYFTGNSLGLQPKSTQKYIQQELNDWANLGVEGHFEAKNPWMPYHEFLTESMAKIVGAKPIEVVVMNTLTTNLHLLMVSFYRPTKTKYKIVIESEFTGKVQEKDIQFSTTINFKTNKTFRTDQDKLHKALNHIIDNAIKFSPKNAIVNISCSPVAEETLQFKISDNGIGISDIHIDKVHLPFFTIDLENKTGAHGAGLGLSIAKSYIELLGGTLQIESEVNKGTTVIFQLNNL